MSDYSTTIDLIPVIVERENGEDRDDLSHEYNAELDNLAPEGVFWGWTESPFIFAPWDADRDALREAFAAATASAEEGGIDLASIAMCHEIN